MQSTIVRVLRLWSRLRGLEQPRGIEVVAEFPDCPDRSTVYLVGEGRHLWFASFGCPCDCGATIQISLLPAGRPRWEAKLHWTGTISLAPSIRRTSGCRSHFFVRRGRIEWCAASNAETHIVSPSVRLAVVSPARVRGGVSATRGPRAELFRSGKLFAPLCPSAPLAYD